MTSSSPNRHPGRAAADLDANRVRAEYGRRAQDQSLHTYYQRIRPALEQASEERRAMLLEFLDRLGVRNGISIIDVGCGMGGDLAFLGRHGFQPEGLAGVDLLEERVAVARHSVPGADVRVGNAAELPHADRSFDVALQSVVLSSVTDARVRSMIAGEMARVVRPGGLLISYDMRTVEARNAQLVPIDEREVRRLFETYGKVEVRTLTLNMAIARWVGPIAARALVRIPLLRSHLLAVVSQERGMRARHGCDAALSEVEPGQPSSR